MASERRMPDRGNRGAPSAAAEALLAGGYCGLPSSAGPRLLPLPIRVKPREPWETGIFPLLRMGAAVEGVPEPLLTLPTSPLLVLIIPVPAEVGLLGFPPRPLAEGPPPPPPGAASPAAVALSSSSLGVLCEKSPVLIARSGSSEVAKAKRERRDEERTSRLPEVSRAAGTLEAGAPPPALPPLLPVLLLSEDLNRIVCWFPPPLPPPPPLLPRAASI